jgi:16S rRNA (adenine1518-N6/adenine1519-N6)-dimethyltransferase
LNHDSPVEIRTELERRGLRLKKRWGQNFMINRGARESLVARLSPEEGECVWEIGPGFGAVTELLMQRSARCLVFEIDRGLCRYLAEVFGQRSGFSLVQGDFVKTWRGALQSYGSPSLLLGNLPYRSASHIVTDIILGGLRPRRAILTMQREAAERMCSQPGLKSYSSFSVLCQAVFSSRILGDLQPGSFYPAPEVISTVVELKPRPDAPAEASLKILEILTRGLFAARRKTIRNNLAAAQLPEGMGWECVMEAFEKDGVDSGARAEELSPETYVRAAKALAERTRADLRGA